MTLQISAGRRGPALTLTIRWCAGGGRRALRLALWLRPGRRRRRRRPHAVLWRVWPISADGGNNGG